MGTAVQRHYTPAEVDKALSVVIIEGGNSLRAAEVLEEEGIPVPASTLREWRTGKHRERYLELAAELQPEIEKYVAASALDYLQRSESVKGDLLDLLKEQVDAKEVKDPASAISKLSVSQGIGIDTVLKIQGRPTQHIAHSSVDESLAALKRLGIVTDSTAEEIPEAEVVEGEMGEAPAVAATSSEADKQTRE